MKIVLAAEENIISGIICSSVMMAPHAFKQVWIEHAVVISCVWNYIHISYNQQLH